MNIKLIFASFCMLILASVAHGQTATFDGVAANGCSTFTAPGDHVLSFTQAVPAGSRLVLISGLSANISVGGRSDSQANSYVTHTSRFSNPVLNQLASAAVTTPLSTTDTLTVNLTGSGSVTSCVSALAFSNVAGFNSQSSAAGTSTMLTSGTVSTVQDNAVIVGGFATETDPGTVTFGSGFTAASPACSGGFCVLPGWQISGTMGSFTATATAANSVNFAGVISDFNDVVVPVELQQFSID